ncbi:MAG: polyphosphate polymerase domain-containing protein, partial [Clostridia bacterium]|nr:polyphosphate polymerase domain-containing protein [Clostridia bacterium]
MAVTVMKRYELKYLLSGEQTEFLRKRLEGHMEVDKYGKTSIASLYYDTPSYRLIRTSVEKPLFKEKIRLRSYGLATDESPVYLELKRKAYGIVYKRRVETTVPLVDKFFSGEGDICSPGQINREITTFRDYYKTLVPSCLIIYDRVAYFEPGGDLRLTID